MGLLKIDKAMQIKRTIALCLLLLTAHAAAAQFDCIYRDIITVYSTNGDYCARATPYYNFDLSPYGKTEVFDARTNQLLYTIPECLSKGFLFLSNDGISLLHLVNLEYKDDEETFSHALTLYQNGSKAKQVSLQELTSCEGCDKVSSLFFRIEDTVVYEEGRLKAKYNYSAPQCEQALHKRPACIIGDTVLLCTANRRLLKICLSTGDILSQPFDTNCCALMSQTPSPRIDTVKFSCPSGYVTVQRYDSGEEALAKKLGMAPQGDTWYPRYKYYYVKMLLRIDRQGKATIVRLDNRDSLPEDWLRKAVDDMTFYADNFPEGVDYWYQKLFGTMRKRNRFVARREGKIAQAKEQAAYQRRLVADSIDGIYIPRNLEESFHVLDTMLPAKTVRVMRSLPDREAMSEFHFGLGMWLRNNWGFWAGSRFQQYFVQRGVEHPDNMSGILLEYYYDYLHGSHQGWRAFDTTIPPETPNDQ